MFPVLHCLPLRISLLPLDPFHLFAFLSVMYASIPSTFIARCIQLYFVSATMFNVALVINKDSVFFKIVPTCYQQDLQCFLKHNTSNESNYIHDSLESSLAMLLLIVG